MGAKVSKINKYQTFNDGQVTFTQQQQAAYDLLLSFAVGESDYSMALLEGYAGTGKTTLVGGLIKTMSEDSQARIAIAAPTNKAVRVLKEKIEQAADLDIKPGREWDEETRRFKKYPIEFASIHSFLGLRLKERDDGTQECRRESDPTLHEYDLVVIDECSMLGRNLLQQIALSKRTARILFVGDPAQLPPIEEGGRVSPVFEQVTHRAMLSEIVRQAADNPIVRLSVSIRQHMERGMAISALDIAEHLPPMPAKAGIVPGGADTVVAIAYDALKDGDDAKVIAYTNQRVKAYNRQLHALLHGDTELPFVIGERVIIHEQHDGRRKLDGLFSESVRLITSEECKIIAVAEKSHSLYPHVPAMELALSRDGGDTVIVYAPLDQEDLDRTIAGLFAQWRQKKAESQLLRQAGKKDDADSLDQEAKKASGQAWGLKKAFASIRHAYAITAHKSQGSTYDTAVIDLSDLQKLQARSAFEFNRALYVAATRAKEHLAIVA